MSEEVTIREDLPKVFEVNWLRLFEYLSLLSAPEQVTVIKTTSTGTFSVAVLQHKESRPFVRKSILVDVPFFAYEEKPQRHKILYDEERVTK